MTDRTTRNGLTPDLAALRRLFWVPLGALCVAVVAAFVIGAVKSDRQEARFRANVIVDALPPLFGPAVLPGPFDFARLAMSDAVIQSVSTNTGVPSDQLGQRLQASPRVNTPEIEFTVTGPNALSVARDWQAAFTEAVSQRTADVERELVQSYTAQLDQARRQLEQRASAAAASPTDSAAQQELTAAQENYETAAKLVQSYDIVASTISASVFVVVAPHSASGGVGSAAGRIGAAIAIGLLAGVAGVLMFDYASRRRTAAGDSVEAPVVANRSTEARPRPSVR